MAAAVRAVVVLVVVVPVQVGPAAAVAVVRVETRVLPDEAATVAREVKADLADSGAPVDPVAKVVVAAAGVPVEVLSRLLLKALSASMGWVMPAVQTVYQGAMAPTAGREVAVGLEIQVSMVRTAATAHGRASVLVE
ncbi:MAG: hypothetical protein ACIAQ0_09205 [Phycisphaerales bacterium JB058]